MLSLADISPGQSATILEVIGDDAIAVRLMEMGLTDGESIRLIGAAPMGDPLEVSVRGYKLSIRKNEASRISVALSATQPK